MPTSLEVIRQACLDRGVSGIMGIGRAFRVVDVDGTGTLTHDEFSIALKDFGVIVNQALEDKLFSSIDKQNLGAISYDEFLRALRPSMSPARCDVINKAFNKLDNNSTTVTTAELEKVYNVEHDPRYQSKEMTAHQVMHEFLNSFRVDDKTDDELTRDEFMDYYSGVSSSIDSDEYFVTMMTTAWKLDN